MATRSLEERCEARIWYSSPGNVLSGSALAPPPGWLNATLGARQRNDRHSTSPPERQRLPLIRRPQPGDSTGDEAHGTDTARHLHRDNRRYGIGRKRWRSGV